LVTLACMGVQNRAPVQTAATRVIKKNQNPARLRPTHVSGERPTARFGMPEATAVRLCRRAAHSFCWPARSRQHTINILN